MPDDPSKKLTAFETKQFEYAQIYYQALVDRSLPVIDDGEELLRFEGKSRALFDEVCPHGSYGTVTKIFDKLHCIDRMRRGAGKDGSSIWHLRGDPQTALTNPITARVANFLINNSPEGVALKTLTDRVTQLEREVVGLHREIKYLRGEPMTTHFVPAPDSRKTPKNELQKLVDFAGKLGVDLEEEEDG